MRKRPCRLWLLIVVLLCLALTACGSSESSSSGGSSASRSSSGPSGTEPSRQFWGSKSPNDIVKFGKEASGVERMAASAVVSTNLKARAEADFAAQCATLSLKVIKEIPGASGRQHCASALRKFASPLSSTKAARKDTLSGSITAFRVEGNRGYALYHGTDGHDYSVVMEKEDGNWKVATLLAAPI